MVAIMVASPLAVTAKVVYFVSVFELYVHMLVNYLYFLKKTVQELYETLWKLIQLTCKTLGNILSHATVINISRKVRTATNFQKRHKVPLILCVQ